jgi:hypothetical protein
MESAIIIIWYISQYNVRLRAGWQGDRGSIPGRGERMFPLASVSGAHPASCTMGTWGPFPGTKSRPGHDVDRSSPSNAEVENE